MNKRLPWIITAAAVAFALAILVYMRVELTRREGARPVATPVNIAEDRDSDTRRDSVSRPAPAPSTSIAGSPGATPAPPRPPSQHWLSGIVTDLDAKPIPNASVALFFGQGGSRTRIDVSAGADGTFIASNLPAPLIDLLVVEAPGRERAQMNRIELPLPNQLEISLAELPKTELSISIARDNASLPEPYTGPITLHVMKQQPADTTASTPIRQPSVAPGQFVTTLKHEAKVSDGRYELANLQPGIYKVAVSVADEYAETAPFEVGSGQVNQLSLVLGLRHTFAAIVGSQATRRPLADALAVLERSSPENGTAQAQNRTLAARNGQFVFEDLLSGSYSLTLAANGHTTRTVRNLTIPAAGETTPVFLLAEGQAGIQVAVTDGDGLRIPKAPLVLIGEGPRSSTQFGQTDATGRYLFAGVSAGGYSVAVTAPDNRTRQKTVPVKVNDGETQQVQVVFAPPVKVSGMASAAGLPYQGLLMFGLRGQTGSKHFGKADAAGAFSVELEPGQYMVNRPGVPGNAVVDIPATQDAAIEVAFR